MKQSWSLGSNAAKNVTSRGSRCGRVPLVAALRGHEPTAASSAAAASTSATASHIRVAATGRWWLLLQLLLRAGAGADGSVLLGVTAVHPDVELSRF